MFLIETNYPAFLQLPLKYHDVYRQTKDEAEKRDDLIAFFAPAKYLVSKLDNDLSSRLAKFWPTLEPKEIAALEPLTQDQLDVAGIRPSRRRSAETIKKVKRALPTGSK